MSTATEDTYLEEFLSSVELLPNDIRRDFELMREVDKECYELSKTINDEIEKIPKTEQQIRDIDSSYARLIKRSAQKSSLASNMLYDLEKFIRKLDADLSVFELELKGSGDFEHIYKGIEVGREVAVRVSGAEGPEVILGRVTHFQAAAGLYDVADADDSRRYTVSERQVLPLAFSSSNTSSLSLTRLQRGEEVWAVYPDTTAFYPATVTQPAKRVRESNREREGGREEQLVYVQFHGDANELGQTQTYGIPVNHVIRPPEDWK